MCFVFLVLVDKNECEFTLLEREKADEMSVDDLFDVGRLAVPCETTCGSCWAKSSQPPDPDSSTELSDPSAEELSKLCSWWRFSNPSFIDEYKSSFL